MKFLLSAWVVLAALVPAAAAQDAVRLKTRGFGRPALIRAANPPGRGHFILQFERFPDEATRRELVRRGVRVLEYVPDNALMAAVPEGFDGRGLGMTGWLRMAGEDKVSPLAAGGFGYYVAVFQPDADMADAAALAQRYGFQVLPATLLPQQLLLAGDAGRLTSLAAWDEVSYIMPASPDLVSGAPALGCAGALTAAGPVGDYVLASQGWPADASGVVSLQYVFGALPAELTAATAESEIQRAFADWQKYANISLSPGTQADAARTIYVEFVNGAHGDSYPFTSTASLAHTFYPDPPNAEPIAGDMHFNAAENWSIGAALDVFSVALHEAGHALGLGHSDQPTAVMYAYYHPVTGLTDDDIAGIQALYGPPASEGAAPSNPPAGNPPASNPAPPNPAPPNPPPSNPGAPPTLAILSPGSTMVSTTAASLAFSGTASAGAGVAAVRWNDAYGNAGAASGTATWSVSVPLLVGTNTITIRAYDAAGNSAWRSVTVVRN